MQVSIILKQEMQNKWIYYENNGGNIHNIKGIKPHCSSLIHRNILFEMWRENK